MLFGVVSVLGPWIVWPSQSRVMLSLPPRFMQEVVVVRSAVILRVSPAEREPLAM